jgi:hypothetical protein
MTLGGSVLVCSIPRFIVGFITMEGAMFVFGACVVVIAGAGSRLHNLVTNHQTMARAVTPAPENTHCLFCTIQSHIVRRLYDRQVRCSGRNGSCWMNF